MDNLPGNNASFNFKQKITGKTGADGTKNVEKLMPMFFLESF